MTKTHENDPESPAVQGALPDFFEGLAWAVPTAFSSALAAYRFEQGDVLFREAAAYAALEGAFTKGQRGIQVMAPKRSARVTPAEFEGDRRRSSWQSEVTIELVDLASGASEAISISQGKLLMLLWHDDPVWLDPGRAEPPLPRTARELAGALEATRAAFAARQKAKSGARFVCVVDLASDASRVKAQTVEQALRELGRVERIDLTPAEAGVDGAEAYHPALILRGLCVRSTTQEAMEGALRGVLYGGANRETDPETPSTDRFSVGRHGLLDGLPWRAAPEPEAPEPEA